VPWLLVLLLLAAAAFAGWWVYSQIQEQLEASEPVAVPNVEGIERALAVERIEQAGLEAEVEEQPSSDVEENFVISQSPDAGARIAQGETVTIVVSTGPRLVQVPLVVGRSFEEAIEVLEDAGLDSRRVNVFSEREEGIVASQNPRPDEEVEVGTEVVIRVSQGTEQVAVPDVLDQTEESASQELQQAGFEVSVVEAPDDDTPEGLVSAQSPDPGIQADRGSTVQITISTGPDVVPVPDVTGMEAPDARSALEGAGFRPRGVAQDTTDPDEEGIVLDQDPPGTTEAERGSTVTIVVGRLVVP
jgi:serine/threonine-protein kinase